ncbi:MAG: MBL fold metallo-hydrolase [Rhodospirillales bacterium]|nr:MBL fold metallo-hydrolase [Rhodospirillales bacterium]
MRVTILGSGSSGGVPVAGTGWGKCDPENPKNMRLRPSILIETRGKTLLIDTSPDLRQQLLNTDIRHIDAVIYSHAHADHLHGIDDLRGINRVMAAPIPMYADRPTLAEIRSRFAYALRPLPVDGDGHYFKPTLVPHEIAAGDVFDVCGVPVSCFDQDHGRSRTLGFRIGNFAYSTDLVNLPEPGFEVLAGIDTWVVGVFTDREHPTHVHVEKALGWIDRVAPRHAVLSHLGPDLDYDQLCNLLPDSVDAAYDGFQISLPDA